MGKHLYKRQKIRKDSVPWSISNIIKCSMQKEQLSSIAEESTKAVALFLQNFQILSTLAGFA